MLWEETELLLGRTLCMRAEMRFGGHLEGDGEACESQAHLPAAAAVHTASPFSSRMARDFKLRLGLCRRQITRDRATNIARAASNVSSALIFGGIFWRMGRSQSAIQDRMGLLQARITPST